MGESPKGKQLPELHGESGMMDQQMLDEKQHALL